MSESDKVKTTIYLPQWLHKNLLEYKDRHVLNSLNGVFVKACIELLEVEEQAPVKILNKNYK